VRSFLENIFPEVFLIETREATILFSDDSQGNYEYLPKGRTTGTELRLL